jgi:NAD(P)-dependent dehydrogenase (short-subunit alcohol dehydrogenase family)
MDGSDPAAVAELAAGLAPIDALVVTISSSAGMGLIAGLDLAELRKGFDEKVIAMLTVLQAALPHVAERASITLAGAISAHAAMPGTAGIAAVNAAVESIVRPLAVELAQHEVRPVVAKAMRQGERPGTQAAAAPSRRVADRAGTRCSHRCKTRISGSSSTVPRTRHPRRPWTPSRARPSAPGSRCCNQPGSAGNPH